jgi:hypothetical protein
LDSCRGLGERWANDFRPWAGHNETPEPEFAIWTFDLCIVSFSFPRYNEFATRFSLGLKSAQTEIEIKPGGTVNTREKSKERHIARPLRWCVSQSGQTKAKE